MADSETDDSESVEQRDNETVDGGTVGQQNNVTISVTETIVINSATNSTGRQPEEQHV